MIDAQLKEHEIPADQCTTTSNPVNPCPTNAKPILRQLDGEDSLTDFRLYCNVVSVCYLDGNHGQWCVGEREQACAVLFEVTFNLKDTTLQHALFPTSVVDTTAIDVFTFPDPNELVIMSSRSVNDTAMVNPNASFGGGSASLGSLSRQTGKKTHEYLQLEKFNQCHDNDVEVQWTFNNHESEYFPSTIRLLVVATKTAASGSFPFKLRILPTLEVHLRPRGWRLWRRGLAPNRDHHGWTFDINQDYRSHFAKHAFDKCQNPEEDSDGNMYSPLVGLHPAVVSYLHGRDRLLKP